MADGTAIEWTDATWNPITGCSVTSPGCKLCYAMKLAGTRLRHHPSRAGLTEDTKAGPVWNGQVRFNEDWLDQPMRWRKPRMIFVCAHSDLFHENVPDDWIDRVFAVMALSPQHTFQVLTKRSARMRAYLLSRDPVNGENELVRQYINDLVIARGGEWLDDFSDLAWPLPNVWLGVSVEDQERYDLRAPDLRQTSAAVRFLSVEPLLGPITPDWLPHWVIVGGESGRGARPMNPAWVRVWRDLCAAGGVPFFFKQWGNWQPCIGYNNKWAHVWPDGSWSHDVGKGRAGRKLDGVEHNGMPLAA